MKWLECNSEVSFRFRNIICMSFSIPFLLTIACDFGTKDSGDDSGSPYPGPCTKESTEIQGKSTIYSYHYDDQELLVYISRNAFPDTMYAYDYDSDRNRTEERYYPTNDASPAVRRYAYNSDSRVIQETYDSKNDGSPDLTTTYEYDNFGNVIKVSNENIVKTFALLLDDAGRVLTVSTDKKDDGTIDEIVRHTYNFNGDTLTSVYDLDANGVVDASVANEYDTQGNLTRMSIDDNADGIADRITDYVYDSKGNLLTETFEGSNSSWSYTYTYECW